MVMNRLIVFLHCKSVACFQLSCHAYKPGWGFRKRTTTKRLFGIVIDRSPTSRETSCMDRILEDGAEDQLHLQHPSNHQQETTRNKCSTSSYKKPLEAPGITGSNKKLLVAPGITTTMKKLLVAPDSATGNKKQVVTPGLALLLGTRNY